jgi:hypothetical protein
VSEWKSGIFRDWGCQKAGDVTNSRIGDAVKASHAGGSQTMKSRVPGREN